jgi:MFS family permease
MQFAAQNWLVLERSRSTTALGASVALQALPTVLFGVWGGLLADRLSRRRLLMVTQLGHALLAALLGLLAIGGLVNVSVLFGLALATGVLAAVEAPASASFGNDLVPEDLLANAIGLGSAVSSTGRVLGMAVAGVVVATVGVGAVFFLNALSYLAVIATLYSLRDDGVRAAPRAVRSRGQIREGFRHVFGTPVVLVTVALAFAVSLFGRNFQVTMAAMTAGPLGAGAGGYGVCSTVFAAGAVAGAVIAARQRSVTHRFLTAIVFVAAGAQLAAGLAPGMVTFVIALVPLGVAAVVIDTTVSALAQLHADPLLRGRTLSILGLVSMAGAALGALVLGGLAAVVGARAALGTGAAITGFAALAASLAFRRTASTVDVDSPSRCGHDHCDASGPAWLARAV